MSSRGTKISSTMLSLSTKCQAHLCPPSVIRDGGTKLLQVSRDVQASSIYLGSLSEVCAQEGDEHQNVCTRFLGRSKKWNKSFDVTSSITNSKVEVPALLIMGEKNYVFKFPFMEDYIKGGKVKEYIPDLEVIYLPEGTHFVREQFP